jgi:hypothetical protein
MAELIVIQCGGKKIWDDNPDKGPTPAKDAYVSFYFKTNRAYAERFGDHWLILSAKYGFLEPSIIIEDYNVSFKKRSTGPISLDKLKSQITNKNLCAYSPIIVLGGEEYYQAVLGAFNGLGCSILSPLRGLKIGIRMSRTKNALREDKKLFEQRDKLGQ